MHSISFYRIVALTVYKGGRDPPETPLLYILIRDSYLNPVPSPAHFERQQTLSNESVWMRGQHQVILLAIK
jgi:hypothetical protein